MAWSAVKFAPYNSETQCIYALNGTVKKRIESGVVYNWGIDAPTTAAVISAVGGGTLTGAYNAKYSYARTEGNTIVSDSNPSEAAGSAVSPSTQALRVEFVDPEDEQVNRIRFWRTAAGGAVYYHDSDMVYPYGDYGCTQQWEIDNAYESGTGFLFTTSDSRNGTMNCFTWEQYHSLYAVNDSTLRLTTLGDVVLFVDLNTADSALGAAVHSDHDSPPAGDYVFGPTFDGTLFIIDGHKLYYSKTKQPEYWPATYYVLIGPPQFPGKCGVLYDKQPFVLTQHRLIYIYGSSYTDFMPKVTAAKNGTISPNGAVAIEGYGIFHVASDGVYLAQPATDSRLGADTKISQPVDRLFKNESVSGMKAIGDLTKSVLKHFKNKLYFFYPTTESTYCTDILVFYLDLKRMGHWTRGHEITAVCEDFENERLLVADSDGYLWNVEDSTVVDDDGTAISWEVESKEFTLQTRAHFPRWNKYDIDASEATTANGYLLLDGVIHHTHSLTENRNTRRRLVDVDNGERCSIRIAGTGPVKIYAVESE